jgi:hypothetical protein
LNSNVCFLLTRFSVFKYSIVCHWNIAVWYKPGIAIRCSCMKWWVNLNSSYKPRLHACIARKTVFSSSVIQYVEPLKLPFRAFWEVILNNSEYYKSKCFVFQQKYIWYSMYRSIPFCGHYNQRQKPKIEIMFFIKT